MQFTKSGLWVWLGLCLVVAAGVAFSGAERRPALPSHEVRGEPTAAMAPADGAADAHADRDVCVQQLD